MKPDWRKIELENPGLAVRSACFLGEGWTSRAYLVNNELDPDYDFMYLFLDFGQAFVKEVARRYGHPDLEQLGIKLRYFGLVDQIDTILYGEGQALEGQTDTAWRRLKQLLQSNGFLSIQRAATKNKSARLD